MKLASLLTKKQVLLQMRAKEHWEAIVELVDCLKTHQVLSGEVREEVLDLLRKREEETSTGIGSGVAIPHVVSDRVEHLVTAFGRSEEGIDFEAIDNAPVKFIWLVIVPKKDYGSHLQNLAEIAKLMKYCEVRKQLENAVSESELIEILSSEPTLSGKGCVTQEIS